jgi:hypothetical protein
MALVRPPAALSFIEVTTLRRQVCGRKARLGQRSAMASARRLRASGVGMSAYPCPFCVPSEGGPWWHLGHPPAMATVELLARYLRFGSEALSRGRGEVGAP